MKLYTYFQSSGAYRVRIALNLKGLAPEMAYINLLHGNQKSADYMRINPQGLVPALLDTGHTLIQSLAIMEYLDEVHPEPPLLPKDPFARAHARALAQTIACDISPLGNLKVRRYLEEKENADKDEIKQWMRHWIEEGLAAFETLLAQSPYTGMFCSGDTPGIADCCLIPQIFNATRWKCDILCPTIERITKACEAHPAFQQAHPGRQKDAV